MNDFVGGCWHALFQERWHGLRCSPAVRKSVSLVGSERMLKLPIPVIDVFAGPGGLNEGFSRVEGSDGAPFFSIAASFEMERSAVETLRLRAAIRDLSGGSVKDLYKPYLDFLNSPNRDQNQFLTQPDVVAALRHAENHVHEFTLSEENRPDSDALIGEALTDGQPWVLIGGPPCQAYSLAGRSRRAHDPTFSDDHKHFLYKEYLHIIDRHRPAVFVMENVKGLLSSTHQGRGMFAQIMRDLSLNGDYEIRSLVVEGDDLQPGDFVIRAEDYGVPQRRHRVILLGLKRDMELAEPAQLVRREHVNTVWDAIGNLPEAQSRVSRVTDVEQHSAWMSARANGFAWANRDLPGPRIPYVPPGPGNVELQGWLTRTGLERSPQHVGRRHMGLDLSRYAYMALFAEQGLSPRVHQLPDELKPAHNNLKNPVVPFIDRFKVQGWDKPSGTVASHIAKDGHYYIHPDPEQMRSLTVREAARLQTFPDDYYFMGTQTRQYQQVGNAVPPYLAMQIAEVVADVLGR